MASTNTELGHRGATVRPRLSPPWLMAVPGACAIHSHEAYSTVQPSNKGPE